MRNFDVEHRVMEIGRELDPLVRHFVHELESMDHGDEALTKQAEALKEYLGLSMKWMNDIFDPEGKFSHAHKRGFIDAVHDQAYRYQHAAEYFAQMLDKSQQGIPMGIAAAIRGVAMLVKQIEWTGELDNTDLHEQNDPDRLIRGDEGSTD
jgi:hypothetical protein